MVPAMTALLATASIAGADAAAVDEAARCLAAGGLVAFPTETVYGLGADATNGAGDGAALRGQGPARPSIR